ncbi:FCS-Like Zinc finger 8-like isoform X2 [Magnolia sinica]|uniref:FCS-Like Zinc finger 8-like isoform X2 n=1 Tax=Magnolia sinica TaxID=86752 RepID=UPI002657D119|nr:FCS-Like Zinc finger 8-like isoform X2 [Magnolia sinica]
MTTQRKSRRPHLAFENFETEEREEEESMLRRQGLMAADHDPLSRPTHKYSRPTSSFFSSPRLFTAFSPKASAFSEPETVMSPTSILDSKTFSTIANPFWSDYNKNAKFAEEICGENWHPWEKTDSRRIGLGIIDSLNDEDKNGKTFTKQGSRMVLFGSQLKIQIPPLPPSAVSPAASPRSSCTYGIGTSNSQTGMATLKTPPGLETLSSPRVSTGCLSASEMELSEDYTCVIAHGPNPRTIHIFDNCIVESCGAIFSASGEEKSSCIDDRKANYSDTFLSFCYACKRDLRQGKDIYMYSGEKAFCSRKCCNQEFLFVEGMEKCTTDSSISSHSDEIVDSINSIGF